MSFGAGKGPLLTITNRKITLPTSYSLQNHTLEKVASPKYLGLELREKLHWSKETNCKGDYTQCVCLENYESMFQLHPGSLVQRPSPTSPGVYIGGMGSQSATTEVRSASASAMVVQLNLENLENC